MNTNKLFRNFKFKLFIEGLVRAVLVALISGGIGAFIVSLIYHIMAKQTPTILLASVSGGLFFLTFVLLFFIKLYPTKKRVAVRMDEMGLNERVCTMLENRNNESKMAELQRKDAALHIGRIKAKQMPFRVLKKEVILSLLSICLATMMVLLPHDIFLFAEEDKVTMDAEQQEIIKDLIENLREEIKKSELDEKTKDKANEIVDKLEEDLNKTDSKLEQAGKIEEAKKELSELLDKQLTKNSIGRELRKYDLTKHLGEAVILADGELVSSALDKLEEKLTLDKELVKELSDTIKKALTDSKVEPTDGLYQAFEAFALDLDGIDKESEGFEEELKATFDKAEEAINEQLKKQAAIEKEKEKLEDKMEESKNELLGKEQDTKPSETGGGSDPAPGEGDKPGEDGKPGDGEGPSNLPGGDKPGDGEGDDKKEPQGGSDGEGDVEDSMTEGIYDPVSGNVAYGKVFASYYAEYLKALEKGEVSEELQEIIDRYFNSLTDTKEK